MRRHAGPGRRRHLELERRDGRQRRHLRRHSATSASPPSRTWPVPAPCSGSDGLFIANASGTFSGIIAGSGASAGLEIGGGTLTLTGANTYASPTQIDAGATLALSGSARSPTPPSSPSSVEARWTSRRRLRALVRAGRHRPRKRRRASSTWAGRRSPSRAAARSSTASSRRTAAAGRCRDHGRRHPGAGGTNTYTGATTIGANSTLSLSNAGSIAASSGVNLDRRLRHLRHIARHRGQDDPGA